MQLQFAYNKLAVANRRELDAAVAASDADRAYREAFDAATREYQQDNDGDTCHDDDWDPATWRAERAYDSVVLPLKERFDALLQPALKELQAAQEKARRVRVSIDTAAGAARDAENQLAKDEYYSAIGEVVEKHACARRTRKAIWQRYGQAGNEAEAIVQLTALMI